MYIRFSAVYDTHIGLLKELLQKYMASESMSTTSETTNNASCPIVEVADILPTGGSRLIEGMV